jgi:hypothetical protein
VEIDQSDGAGQFESVTLRPHAKLAAGSDENVARRLHDAPLLSNALSPALWRSKSITIRPSKSQWRKPIARCRQELNVCCWHLASFCGNAAFPSLSERIGHEPNL